MIHLLATDIYFQQLPVRTPFHDGPAATVASQVLLRLRAVCDGQQVVGCSAQTLDAGWLLRRAAAAVGPESTRRLTERVVDLLAQACRIARELPRSANVFDLWRQVEMRQQQATEARADAAECPRVLWELALGLVERALIDAFCRSLRLRYADALRANALGIRMEELHPSLAHRRPGDFLTFQPIRRVVAGHVVGLDDPLIDAEVPPGRRGSVRDPVSLESVIHEWGVNTFTVRLSGDAARDIDRLTQVARIVQTDVRDFTIALDGDERYADMASFREFWERARRDMLLHPFLRRLRYVVQPLPRATAMTDTVRRDLHAWTEHPPLLIDASDVEVPSLSEALDMGYSGGCWRTCRGVFRNLGRAFMLAQLNQQRRAAANGAGLSARARRWRFSSTTPPLVLAGTDLAAVGPVEFLQEMAIFSAVGLCAADIQGPMRFHGWRSLPAVVNRQAMACHADVVEPGEGEGDRWPVVHLHGGGIDIGTAVDAPFGVGFDPDLAGWTCVTEGMALAR